ncbi:drug/metabolite transporter (DMT)-like permease [Oikeobacillus pervagus]|uniref:Drug/metabolite transporter (DMT)-like permease n=1 Tax=Oikeobacillus pervagus TaxID=1325931 RepID=A0AAJ1T2Q6_9BACI|nr:DMT family transporter [Oikeobacillus pervagus]MDQ0216087.1 drug/metabolite transporter (DMT)-like permease [Oikeobacillus pervagus]
MKTSRQLGLVMIITGATFWGLSGPMIQWFFQQTNMSSSDFLVIRLLLAGITMLGYLAFVKKQNILAIWKHKSHSIQLVLFSIIGMLGAQYTFIEALQYSNAVTATLFQFLGPVLITIYVSVQGRSFPSRRQFLAVVAAIAGTYFLITNGSIESIVLSKQAILFGILTAVGFAFYTIQPAPLIKKWGTLIIVGWGMLLGGIVLLIFNHSLTPQYFTDTLTMSTFAMLLVIIASGTLSFVLYIGSLKYLTATETGILSSIEPFVAAIVSVIWLKEVFGAYQLLGGLFIIIAVIFLTTPDKKLKRRIAMEQSSEG